METLLTDIEAFIKAHGLTEWQFGIYVLNDKNLVAQIRGDKGKRPRRLWPETEAKVRDKMASYQPASQAA